MDARHFLWIGTNAGLEFYDGSNMVHVAFPEVENAVPPLVFSLSEDEACSVCAGMTEKTKKMQTKEESLQFK